VLSGIVGTDSTSGFQTRLRQLSSLMGARPSVQKTSVYLTGRVCIHVVFKHHHVLVAQPHHAS
jgi:hypothetical protein